MRRWIGIPLLVIVALVGIGLAVLATPIGHGIVAGLIERFGSTGGLTVTVNRVRGWPPFWLGADRIEILNAPVDPDNGGQYVGLYLTDTWRLNRRLTLSLGGRYAYDKVSEKELDEETEEDGAMTLDDAAKVDLADEWTPSPEFNPAMRLTQERMEDFGQVALSGATKGSVNQD